MKPAIKKSLAHFLAHYIQGKPKKVSYCTFSTSLLNIDKFSQFVLLVDFGRNLLLSDMHTTSLCRCTTL